MYDSDGVVFGRPSDVQVDVLIWNGLHTLIEIKASLGDADAAKLFRLGGLYEKITGVKPKFAAICPFVTDRGYALAKDLGIRIFRGPEDVPAR